MPARSFTTTRAALTSRPVRAARIPRAARITDSRFDSPSVAGSIPLFQLEGRGDASRAVSLLGLLIRIDVEVEALGWRFSVGHGGRGHLPRRASCRATFVRKFRQLSKTGTRSPHGPRIAAPGREADIVMPDGNARGPRS